MVYFNWGVKRWHRPSFLASPAHMDGPLCHRPTPRRYMCFRISYVLSSLPLSASDDWNLDDISCSSGGFSNTQCHALNGRRMSAKVLHMSDIRHLTRVDPRAYNNSPAISVLTRLRRLRNICDVLWKEREGWRMNVVSTLMRS